MANSISSIQRYPAAASPLCEMVSTASATGTIVFVTVAVTSNSGGAIAAGLVGLKDLIGGITSDSNASVSSSADTFTTPNTTGTYHFVLWGEGVGMGANS